VILPGSKATIADLKAFKAEGWDIDLAAHLRRGGWVVGLCGGYQMLGRSVADPGGVEGPAERWTGLACSTWRRCFPATRPPLSRQGRAPDGLPVEGYEIHLGATKGADCDRPLACSRHRDPMVQYRPMGA
jgi:adenosylcobyric acid synthase